MITENFKNAYKKLNKEQKLAVDTIEGPVIVIAGPGTGKTQILALRIGNILQKTDTAPDNILAITFTEAGVSSMRKRLVSLMGSVAYRVPIYTFHGFCNDVIARFPEYFPRIIGRTVLSTVDQIKLCEKLIESEKITMLRPYGEPYYYVRDILNSIRDLKRETITPEDFKKAIEKEEWEYEKAEDKYHEKGVHKGKLKGVYADKEKQIQKHKELLILYIAYEKVLSKEKHFDYEDMILEAVEVIEKEETLRLILQEEYQYILADEHQDANTAQNKVLELLSSFHENPNLFIVGDEKQAIFRFQGASLENFLYFKNKFPKAKVVALTDNYRSHQNILDSAHSLIGEEGNSEVKRPRLIAKGENVKKDNPIELRVFSNTFLEEEGVAEEIKELINGGVSPKEIAVFYRENKEASAYGKALSLRNVPFVIHSEGDALHSKDIQKLLLLLRAIENPTNDHKLGESLFLDFLNIPPLDVYKLFAYKEKERFPLSVILKNEKFLESSGVESSRLLLDIYDKFLHWHSKSKNKGLSDTLDIILKESGFLERVIKDSEALSILNKLDAVLDFARTLIESKRDCGLSDFLSSIDTLTLYNMGISVKEGVGGEESVSLMTSHRAKGLEFEYVFIANLIDGKWGGRRSRDSMKLPVGASIRGEDSDERRLFYVALTRAKHKLYLSYARSNFDGKDLTPSRFLTEIREDLIKVEDTEKLEKKLRALPHHLLRKDVALKSGLFDEEYLRERFFAQGMAVTALNNYLNCPWRYFFVNLIRLPQSQSRSQLYGIAVHNALKETIDRVKAGEEVNEESFFASFLNLLSKLPFSKEDYDDSLEKGKKSLIGYFKKESPLWNPSMTSEVNIKAVPIDISIGVELMLKGKLDRMDVIKDGEVSVLDYKTEKPKSRNEIEGNTKNSNGDKKRQLVFYKLLVDEYYKNKLVMKEGRIDFIEPNVKGKYISEKFVITDEEVGELKELIKKVAGEITTFSFKNSGCQKKDCEYCNLAQTLI